MSCPICGQTKYNNEKYLELFTRLPIWLSVFLLKKHDELGMVFIRLTASCPAVIHNQRSSLGTRVQLLGGTKTDSKVAQLI